MQNNLKNLLHYFQVFFKYSLSLRSYFSQCMIGFPDGSRWFSTTSEINFKQCSKQKTTDGRQKATADRETDRRE